eukprot:4367624-Lingulodinium_polyedra.AAC.1
MICRPTNQTGGRAGGLALAPTGRHAAPTLRAAHARLSCGQILPSDRECRLRLDCKFSTSIV